MRSGNDDGPELMATRTGGDVLPAMSAGFLLLVFGYFLFLGGGAILSDQPQTLGLWAILVGMVLLLGGMTLTLVRHPSAAPVRSRRAHAARLAAPPPARPVEAAAPEPEPDPVVQTPMLPEPAPLLPTFSAEPAVRRAAALAAEGPGIPLLPLAPLQPSSIPATYLQAISTAEPGIPPWSEVAPPMTAALPFTAGLLRANEAAAAWDEDPPVARSSPPPLSVELELSQLRARVRELEIPSRPASLGPSSATHATASLSIAPMPAQDPPAPPASSGVVTKACIGCGTGLTTSGPAQLCWGCGRTLCATCYWRYGAGPGLHRCPDCLRRAPSRSEAISGGLGPGGPSVGPLGGPAGPATSMR